MSQGQSPPESLEARLERLRSKMIRGLGERSRSLREAASLLEGGDRRARESLRRLGHKLRGSAGSHGLGALGDEAADLERLAKSDASDGEVVAASRALAESALNTLANAPSERRGLSMPPPPRTPPPSRAEGASLRILAVDDDESIARLIQLTLSRMGDHQITTLASAEEALEHLSGHPPPYDLVLVDAMMPGKSGIELCEALRAVDQYRDIPLVILSAASPEELGWLTRVEAASVDAWLRKPIRMAELIEKVNQVRR